MNFLLRDLRNHEELEKIFHKYEIDTIYHSAAYKHVPLLQQKENFISAIENNFFVLSIYVVLQKNLTSRI